jgi:hypothetical protein
MGSSMARAGLLKPVSSVPIGRYFVRVRCVSHKDCQSRTAGSSLLHSGLQRPLQCGGWSCTAHCHCPVRFPCANGRFSLQSSIARDASLPEDEPTSEARANCRA